MLRRRLHSPDQKEADSRSRDPVDNVESLHASPEINAHPAGVKQPRRLPYPRCRCIVFRELQSEAVESVKIQIRLPAELAARLNAAASSRGIGLSTLIRMFCYACLEKPS